MEANGLVHREVYAEVPPRVEYSLTELGKSLKPILDSMWAWGEEYKKQFHDQIIPLPDNTMTTGIMIHRNSWII